MWNLKQKLNSQVHRLVIAKDGGEGEVGGEKSESGQKVKTSSY